MAHVVAWNCRVRLRQSMPLRLICMKKYAGRIARSRRWKRKRGRGSEDLGVEAGTPFSVLLSSLRAPTPKGAALLSDQSAAPPIVVYTGPTRTPSQIAALSAIEEAAPHHKKKGGKTESKTAAKPAEEEATDDQFDPWEKRGPEGH